MRFGNAASFFAAAVLLGSVPSCRRADPRPPATAPDAAAASTTTAGTDADSRPTAARVSPLSEAHAPDAAAVHPPPRTIDSGSPSSPAPGVGFDPAALAECVAPRALVSLPPRGAIFNNAMPAAKAKAGDRAQGVLDALAERERSFACCFEAWLDATAESEVRITLRIVLEPAGMVRSAELVHRPEAPLDVRAVQCLEHVASTIEFPASPAGRETVVEYPLRVKRGTSTQGD